MSNEKDDKFEKGKQFVKDFLACLTDFVDRLNGIYFVNQKDPSKKQLLTVEHEYGLGLHSFLIRYTVVHKDDGGYPNAITLGEYGEGNAFFYNGEYFFNIYKDTPESILYELVLQCPIGFILHMNELILEHTDNQKLVTIEQLVDIAKPKNKKN